MQLSEAKVCFVAALVLIAAPAHMFGQFKVELVNPQGAALPCIGIGPAASLGKKCVEMFQQAGFIRKDELGFSGLTVGTAGHEDGIIVAVQPGSPAAVAGLEVGDEITAVGGKPVNPTPGTIAAQAVFGQRGEPLHLKVRRHESDQNITVVRLAQNAPAGPKSPSMFISVKPVINWRGQFAPCMGAGLAGPANIEYCDVHLKPYGFIKTGQLGSTGFQIDLQREDKATISSVDPDSAASKAGVQLGDEIVSVEGHPLEVSLGESANQKLFGKAGDHVQITVRTGQTSKTVDLLLTPRPKE